MSKQVWIIDDDTIVGNILTDHLRGFMEFDPSYFSNAKDAYKMLDTIKPDIILLDWVMPDHDGMELLRVLKKKAETASIPVFMVTGKASVEAFEIACQQDISGYFTKPIDYFKVSKRIKFFFDNFEQQCSLTAQEST
jgi:DNA-binding response OmpR family regulator